MAVHKSGKGGLYERRFPNLVGLSRNFIQQAINSLISIGRVEVTKSGLILKNLDGTTGEDVRPLKRVAVQEFSHA
jgi:hypothetical protein